MENKAAPFNCCRTRKKAITSCYIYPPGQAQTSAAGHICVGACSANAYKRICIAGILMALCSRYPVAVAALGTLNDKMKMRMRIITLLILLLISYSTASVGQTLPAKDKDRLPLQPQVDLRVELLSIVFRLAGNEEYSQDRYKDYVRNIYLHFDPHKHHPVVAYAKKLAYENGVGFDAVMSMAVHLENPPSLQPVIPFSAAVPESRWSPVKAHEFALLLRQFYQDANCEAFFNSNQAAYEAATESFRQVLRKVDISWYKAFYGKAPEGKFKVVIGLGNGGGNYGPKVTFPNGHQDMYAIIGTWKTDSAGKPVYADKEVLPIIIHEFNHSFVNFLIDKNKQQLQTAGEKIFGQVEQKMRAQAYGSWQTMLYEALVRASVIKYMRTQKADDGSIKEMIAKEERNGFFWMADLVHLLDEYEKNRKQYSTLETFMPQLVTFYSKLSGTIAAKQQN